MSLKQVAVLAIATGLLFTAGAPAGEKPSRRKNIDRAIQRGVAYLKQMQNPTTGAWTYVTAPSGPAAKAYSHGATALAGLTLLLCDIPGSDPIITKAADYIRNGASGIKDTYTLSLCIMFFDRLGDKKDVPLIQTMADQLLRSQLEDGSWSYNCVGPAVSSDEKHTLEKLDGRQPTIPPAQPSRPNDKTVQPPGPGAPPHIAFGPPPPPPLPQDAGNGVAGRPAKPFIIPGDNSNTQFATLALWIARRHGVKVDDSLRRLSQYLRGSQNSDGGWPYIRGKGSTGSMTCAGLIGVAVGHGLKGEDTAAKMSSDPHVARGRLFLGRAMYNPPSMHRDYFYFLWSLERTAVIYGWKKIGGNDWYSWGCDVLMRAQTTDGGWHQANAPPQPVDTCFALMFLKHANLALDLTHLLRRDGGTGEHRLRQAGNPADDDASKDDEHEPATTGPAPGIDDHSPTNPAPARQGAAPQDSLASRLASQLASANEDQQKTLLVVYRDGKGSQYTDALAEAIHQLSGDARERARDALAERLSRMTLGTLRSKLQDDDREIRSAAALACGNKQARSMVPDLIEAIKDIDGRVAQAARVALKSLTQRDFGPPPTATQNERRAVAERWRIWWNQHKSD